jgi:hypothetical protein
MALLKELLGKEICYGANKRNINIVVVPKTHERKLLYMMKGVDHKVRRVPQCMSPRRNWDSPTPSLASEYQYAPPPGNRGGAHSTAGKGLGES